MMSSGLAARWTLRGDCRDCSGNGLHGEARGDGVLSHDGAYCSHATGYIAIPHSDALPFGKGPFTIAAWVHTEDMLNDVTGDIAGKYDATSRKGLNFCLQTFHGVTSAQPNYRNLFFGIDDGAGHGAWSDCGRPGDCLMVWALCVYEGRLYAGTFETGNHQRGHVYRYEGGEAWTDCGAPHPSNAITSLAVYDGHLYAAASHYRSAGSSLADSDNTVHGGHIFRYSGGSRWEDCGRIGESEAVGGLCVFGGRLYASSMYAPAGLFRYEGKREWQPCGNPGGRVEALGVYRGHLYGSGWDLEHSGVYRFDGLRCCGGPLWTDCGGPPETNQTYSFAVYQGRLYAGTWPAAKVFRYGGAGQWEDCGRLDEELEVMGMAVYNGKLYAGTLPLAAVYRYDGDGQWASTGRIDLTPDVKYRRVWSMAVYDGRLFAGTLPSGRVHAFACGACVSHDRELRHGWRHVAAVRDRHELRLFVDGKRVAARAASVGDIANTQPFTIGFGAHGVFNGRIRDVCVFDRALSSDEVATMPAQTARTDLDREMPDRAILP